MKKVTCKTCGTTLTEEERNVLYQKDNCMKTIYQDRKRVGGYWFEKENIDH